MIITPNYTNGFYPQSDCPQHPSLWTGCLGAWCPSIGNTGGSLPDWSRGRHGTLNQLSGGWTPRGLEFSGSGSTEDVDLGSIVDPNPLNLAVRPFSISFWFLWGGSGDTFARVMDKSTGGNAAGGYFVSRYQTTRLSWMANGSGLWRYSEESMLVTDEWAHCVLRGNAASPFFEWFRNGIPWGTSTQAAHAPTTTATLKIGARVTATTQNWDGQLDDIRFYNRTLSLAEIQLLADRPAIAYEPRQSGYVMMPASGGGGGGAAITEGTRTRHLWPITG